jgi:hypothetical protein
MTEPNQNKELIIEKILYVGEIPIEIVIKFKSTLEQLLELMIEHNIIDIKIRVKKE